MAVDVWNMVKTKGINARIAAGNIDKPHADWKEFNHAWVVAEAAPRKWIALETTGVNLVQGIETKITTGVIFSPSPESSKITLSVIGKEMNF